MARRGPLTRLRNRLLRTRLGPALRWPRRGAQALRDRVTVAVMGRLRAAALAWPGWMVGPLRLARRVAPRRRGLAQAEALATARSAGWEAAAPLLRAIDEDAVLTGAPGRDWLAPPRPHPAADLVVPVRRDSADLPAATGARIVVYTACIGARAQLPPLAGVPEGVRCVCFTDHAIAAPGWEIVPPAGDSEAAHRIRPHAVLAGVAPEAEWSLYLAPDRVRVGNLHTLLGRWLSGQDFALWRHDGAIDWHELAEHHLVAGTAPAAELLAQLKACAGLARDRGACDTGVIWRRHGDDAVTALMESWWAHHAETGGAADLSLYRLLHGSGAPEHGPALLPASLGPSGDSQFFAHHHRRRVAVRPGAEDRVARPGAGDVAARPGAGDGRIPVTFLYAPQRADSLTTLLRARQLSELVAAHLGDLCEVSFVGDPAAVRDSVVIANVLAIGYNDVETLAELQARNIAVIGDWLDGGIQTEKLPFLDAHMALSLRQMLDLNRAHPQIPAFHVTHHVSTRIPPITSPDDRLRTGYFGDLANTTLPDSLTGAVDLVHTSSNRDFHDILRDYNCHWIVRRTRPGYGAKPFLKGFVAARCSSVVLVTRDDPNAVHYLGDDYPFYAESLDPADLEMAWARMAGAFGGPDWRMAQEIMRQVAVRSSDAQVAAEFRAMIDEILA